VTLDQSVSTVTIVLFSGMLLAILGGWSQIQSARKLPYFTLRRERTTQGWRWILLGVILGILGLSSIFMGNRIAYMIVPPTPSITPTRTQTLTPTITPLPSITATASITPTPTISPTPTITPTPALPEEVEILLRESITPNPEAIFSPIQVALLLGGYNQPLGTREEFELPLTKLYGTFTYENLQDGVRWTALWLRGDEVVCIETQLWDGGTGGYGYTECEVEVWQPGSYEIRMFFGKTWKNSVQFMILSGTPTPVSTSES
jgi:hypothetical protein